MQVSASLCDDLRCQKKVHLPVKEGKVGMVASSNGSGVHLDMETYADTELYHALLKDFLNDSGGRWVGFACCCFPFFCTRFTTHRILAYRGGGVLANQEQMQFISKRLRGQRRKDLERRATKGRMIKYEVMSSM